MNLKREMFIFFLLFLLIFSISVVSANEKSLDDSSTDELILLSNDNNMLANAINDEVTADTLDDSSADLSAQDTENQGISESKTIQKNILGASNIEETPLKANPTIINLNGGTVQNIMNTMSNNPNSIIYLNGKTYTGVGTITSKTFNNITIIGGSQSNPNTMAIFNTNLWPFKFKNCNLTNITFKSLKGDHHLFNISGGTTSFSVFDNCQTYQNLIRFESNINSPANVFYTNFTNSRQTYNGDSDGNGQFAVLQGCIMDHCNFINTYSGHHGGAFCSSDDYVNNRGKYISQITNTNFVNITSRWFAVYFHGESKNNYQYWNNRPAYMENCSFINCNITNKGTYGVALGISHDNMIIKNCSFINNRGVQGSAIMIGGISNPSVAFNGDNTHGHNVSIIDCTFNNNVATTHGGAIYIVGNTAKIYNCTFINNTAQNGKGSGVYIQGNSATLNDTKFYNHTSINGSVYINGNLAVIDNSTFENNSAVNGAAVFIKGTNAQIKNNNFTGNNVSDKGGAIYIDGSTSLIADNIFELNNAIPELDKQGNPINSDDGLGGAMYVKGDNTVTNNNTFNHNTARNGSAIYTDGKNFQLTNDTFYHNQAYSYLLMTTAEPYETYYKKEPVVITVVHRGGDNIINAIYNKADNTEIKFLNVSYTKTNQDGSDEQIHTNQTSTVKPVNGVEASQNGTYLYQDSREAYQNITLKLYQSNWIQGGAIGSGNDPDGYYAGPYPVKDLGSNVTDIYGKVNLILSDLSPNRENQGKIGYYTVTATHPEDWNYKYITNRTTFRVLTFTITPDKTVSNETPFINSEIEYNLTITNDADVVYSDKGYQINAIYEHTGGE